MRVMPLEPLSLVRSLAIALVKSLVLELAQSLELELATIQPIFAVAVTHRPIAVVWLPSPRALN